MAYIGNIPADKYQTLQKQSFTTSATDTYTLSYSVTNPQDLALFINNVRQNPNDAYTVSGTTLTLSSAITGSDTMYAVFLGRAVETIAPATGSVTNAMLAGSIATSKLADITANGITMADQWRLTTSFSATTGSTQVITSNLERVDGSGQGTLGSGMTESSGVFTFPSTGIYLVRFGIYTFDNNVWTYCYNKIEVTTNNSTYNNRAFGSTSMTGTMSNYPEQSTLIDTLVDVTDTANVKVRFAYTTPETISISGDTNANKTYFTFIRLGDT
jgi:hypothetical protein